MKAFNAVPVGHEIPCITVDDFQQTIYTICEDIAAMLPDDCSTDYDKGYMAGLTYAFSKVYPLIKKSEDC